jgi:hypothetical protein
MTVGQLITQMSMVGADGVEVPLMLNPVRKVSSVTGLSGIASREVVIDKAGRSGSRNLTRYRTDQPISITGILNGVNADDTWNHWHDVGAVYADAIGTECLLKWTAGSSLALQRMVRLTSLDGPLAVGPDIITYLATLRADDPNAYSQELHEMTAGPLGSARGGGLVFPATFPWKFLTPPTVSAAITNNGFLSTPPIFSLFGYLLNPVVQLDENNAIVINGEVGANDLLVIDVNARMVTLNGTGNRRDMINTAKSTWFELPRGDSIITLLADNWTAGAGVNIYWRDASS